MPNAETISVTDATPIEAWEGLKNEASSALIDVRTNAEWAFVGLPDLSEIGKKVIPMEWVTFPEMRKNAAFIDQLHAIFEDEFPDTIYFLCRSGVRSLAAAELVASLGRNKRCVNVLEGFEGDLDSGMHRGGSNGWKSYDLPWRQS